MSKPAPYYPIPRKRRGKVCRSKDPAINEADRVGSYAFDGGQLRGAVWDGQMAARGNGSTGAPRPVESLGLLFGRGWRLVRAQ